MIGTRVLEALGFKWTLEPNDLEGEQGRSQLRFQANAYANSFTRPVSKHGAWALVDPYFGDIVGALTKLETLDDPAIDVTDTVVIGWISDISTWASWLRGELAKGNGKGLSELWKVAKELNPDWYPPDPLAEAPPDVKGAAEDLQKLDEFVDAPGNSDHPDTGQLTDSAKIVATYLETTADAGGLVGPLSFPESSEDSAQGVKKLPSRSASRSKS